MAPPPRVKTVPLSLAPPRDALTSPSQKKKRKKRRRGQSPVGKSPQATTTPIASAAQEKDGHDDEEDAVEKDRAPRVSTMKRTEATTDRDPQAEPEMSGDERASKRPKLDPSELVADVVALEGSNAAEPSTLAMRIAMNDSPRRGSVAARRDSVVSARSRSSSFAASPRPRRTSSSSSESSYPPPPLPTQSDLLIGAGMYDITGPAAEVGMFGYAKGGQLTSGIHMRLRARAFAFLHEPTNKACVYVCCDLGMISEWVTQTVISRLAVHKSLPKGLYSRENVMISATHTHCAPGGMSHYFIYSMHPPLRGADRQNFECVVEGIVQAIVRAHNNLQPGVVRVAKGECLNASVNRSEEAYNANPESERAKYKHNTDKEMTLWRLDGVNGFPIGMINWFAVHPTSMGNWYTLITGDNKGYAAHVFEQEHGTNHLLDRPRSFVAAFAQSNEGDVSPNICGPRHHVTQHKDFERMLIVANAQLKKARDLYRKAQYSPVVMGPIKFAHQYVEYGTIKLLDKWHVHEECSDATSPGCIGVSMISGTSFDGRGVEGVREGIKWGTFPKVTTVPDLQLSQKEKPVIFPTASYGLSPTVLPLQLFIIGDTLSLAAIPFEATTMAGRRLRSTLQSILVDDLALGSASDPVISGLSNAYSGYLTTREEFAVQRYEGASTHFGPNQLNATLQQFEVLAHAACASKEVPFSTLSPPKITGVGVLDYNLPVVHDGLLPNADYGDIITDVLKEYRPGSTVTATFHAAHPKNNLRTQGTFLEVHRWIVDGSRQDGGVWVMHADDGDANTFFHWRRCGTFASTVTVEWCIPESTPSGRYRLKVNGDFKRFFAGNVSPYSGVSSAFEIAPPTSDGDDEEDDGPFYGVEGEQQFIDSYGNIATMGHASLDALPGRANGKEEEEEKDVDDDGDLQSPPEIQQKKRDATTANEVTASHHGSSDARTKRSSTIGPHRG